MENVVINKTKKTDIFKIDPRSIDVVAGFNSRTDFGDLEELASQIKVAGVLNPIRVQLGTKDENGNQRYRLVDGERRYRAVMLLLSRGEDIARIPAVLSNKTLSDEELLLQQIMCNEGKPFNEFEYGIAYSKLIDKTGHTRDELASKVGKKRWHIDVCLAHMERDEKVQELLRTNKIEGSTVRKIYQAHKDEAEAVKEILQAVKNFEKKQSPATDTKKVKKKITLDDLDKATSKTISVRDTFTIKKGLLKLIEYYQKFGISLDDNVDIVDIAARLKSDNQLTIDTLLNDIKSKGYREAE